MNHDYPVPATAEEAIDVLVSQDVEKWGEAEREASRRLHSRLTYGRLLNSLWSRAEMAGVPRHDLRAASDDALTAEDWRVLRSGG